MTQIPPPAPAPAKKSNMLIIIIVVVVGLFFVCGGGCCIGWAFLGFGARTAASTVGAVAPRLVQEGLASKGVHVDISGNGVSLPDNYPSDLPQYPGSKVTAAITPPDQTDAGTVFFQTSATKKQVMDFFKNDFAAKGWKTTSVSDTGDGAMILFNKDDRQVMVTYAGDKEGTVNVVYGTDKSKR